MKLDQLRVLRAVVETGSLKAAAERLNRTQPAVSQALKALELQTGTTLFDRSGYRLELTVVGKRVYLQALRILTEVEDLNLLVRHFEQGREETITVAVDVSIDLDAVIPVLTDLQTRFPETHVVLRSEVLSGTLDAVRSGEAALGIGLLRPVMPEAESFDYMPVSGTAIRVVTAPSLLARMGTLRSRTDLRRFHQVITRDSGQVAEPFDRKTGIQKGQRRWYVSDLHMKKHMLVAGLGWGHMPDNMIANEVARGHLREINLPNTDLSFDVSFYVFRKQEVIVGPVAAFLWEGFGAKSQ